jgi:hypothetical protein
MKFGTTKDPVHAFSFKVVTGFASAEDPLKDTVKFLTHVDGSIEVLNFGARQERVAEFALAEIPKDQFIALVNYLSARTGEKIPISEENEGEKFFTESFLSRHPLDYFAYLLEVGGMQEEDFSATRELFSLNVKIAFAGRLEDDEINAPGSSTLDVLIDIDTVRADFTGPGEPQHTDEGEPLRQGMRWLDMSVEPESDEPFPLREFTETGAGPLGGNWERIIFTVPQDVEEIGFSRGVFRLAAFADTSVFVPAPDGGTEEIDYKSGWINYQSISLPGKSIDISKGPAIAHREGFSFSINDANGKFPKKFWSFLIENGINLFGARCSISVYRKKSEVTVTRLMSGVNRSNSFTYTDYKFQVEPFLLSSSTTFPSAAIDPSQARYADVGPELVGKPPYVTYGEHDMAALQNISTKSESLEFGFRFLSSENESAFTGKTRGMLGYIDLGYHPTGSEAGQKRIIVPSTEQRKDGAIRASRFPATYEITADQEAAINQGDYVLRVTFDNDEAGESAASDNGGKAFKIKQVIRLGTENYQVQDADEAEFGGHYFIVEDKAGDMNLPQAGGGTHPGTDSAIGLEIVKHAFKYQSGEAASGGFGAFDKDVFNRQAFALFNLKESQKEMVQIPATDFTQNQLKNLVQIDPVLASDASKGLAFVDSLASFHDIGAPVTPGFTPVFLRSGSPLLIDPALFEGSGDPVPYFKAAFAGSAQKHNFIYTQKIGSQNTAEARTGESGINSKEISANVVPLLYAGALKGFAALVARFSINHGNDAKFLNKSELRIALSAEIQSNLDVAYSAKHRDTSLAVSFTIRFRKYDGTYVNCATYKFDNGMLSVFHAAEGIQSGKILIDNLPSGQQEGGFGAGTNESSLKTFYDHLIRYKFDDSVNLDPPGVNRGLYEGELAWRNGLWKWTGSAWTTTEVPVAHNGDRIYLFQTNGASSSIVSGTPSLYTVEPNGPNKALRAIDEPVASINTLKGMDLFNVTDFFKDPSDQNHWSKFESMEIVVGPTADPRNPSDVPGVSATTDPKALSYRLDLSVKEPPRLMIFNELELEDRPAFSALQGKVVDLPPGPSEAFPSNALAVAGDILASIYPHNFSKPDFFQEPSLASSRTSARWAWRKQFTKAADSTRVLQELLDNLWAAAIFNESDDVMVKSLDLGDHGDPRAFNETNVLKDSVTEPRFRLASDTFQVFKLDFDYFPPSEFSNALEKYRKRMVVSGDKIEDEMSFLLRASADVYQIKNEYVKAYDYHYNADSLPFAEALIRWMAFNSWSLKFKVSLDKILNGEGNRIELMDKISLDNFFYTRVPGSQTRIVTGFVTSIQPDVYNGTVEIGMYVPNPPGVFGIICDPFYNALELPGRGPVPAKDAGDFYSPRDFDLILKDAGNFNPTRTITC